jgi:hypothetical protein
VRCTARETLAEVGREWRRREEEEGMAEEKKKSLRLGVKASLRDRGW